jgi:hypothetical protein
MSPPASHTGTPIVVMSRLLAGLALVWCAICAPALATGSAVAGLGRSILAGHSYRDGELAPFVQQDPPMVLGSACRPGELIGRIAIVGQRLAIAEADGTIERFDGHLAQLETETRRLLRCSPHSAFGWFMLYWSDGHRNGFGRHSLAYLQMSYRTGPREGWVAARRGPQAILVLPDADPDLKQAILMEWSELVDWYVFEPAAAAISHAAEVERAQLQAMRHRIRPGSWRSFGAFLDQQGSDVILQDGPALRPRAFNVIRP